MPADHAEVHLITGATGFIGAAVVLELLQRTDAELTCLVRATPTATPHARLREALRAAAAAYGLGDCDEGIDARCRAVEGDLLRERCGVEPAALGPITKVWHCAASLRYEDEHKDAILATNLDGTRHVIELTHALNEPDFLYISTAYVAGDRTGHIEETRVAPGTTHNNWYERSKVAAEHLVENAGLRVWKILRPSIVIGHSRTFQATSYTGLYGFLRGFDKFDEKVSEELGSFLKFRPMRFLADPDCLINFIPVDAAAETIARIGLEDERSASYYHVASRAAAPVGDGLALVCAELGLSQPSYIDSESDFSSIDDKLDQEIRFYRSYLNNSKTFDISNSAAVVGAKTLEWSLPSDELQPYVQWYVERLRAGKSRAAVVVGGG